MELSPADVTKMEFSSALRGFDTKEVREFLAEIATVLSKLYTEKQAFLEKIAELEERTAECRQMEQVLKKTLQEAHQTADQLREHARKDAELIKNEARKEAEELTGDARREVEEIKSHIRSLNGQRLAFLEEMEATLGSYKRILERLKEETADDDPAN